MTIKSKFGLLAYVGGYILLPAATFVLAQMHGGRPLGVILHFLSCVIPPCCLMRHDMIHCEPSVRKQRAAGELLGWIWSSKEWDRLSTGHMRHHFDPKAHNRFYSLVPYGHFYLWITCGDAEDGYEAVHGLSPAVSQKLEPWLQTLRQHTARSATSWPIWT
jgi:hypothetical protein